MKLGRLITVVFILIASSARYAKEYEKEWWETVTVEERELLWELAKDIEYE